MFVLRMLMEKYREGERELHCVFVDLEKAYDRVAREELWYCMRKSGIVEKYLQLVQEYVQGKQNSGEVCSSDVNRAAYTAACGRAVQRSNLFWRILPRANYEKFCKHVNFKQILFCIMLLLKLPI